MSIRVNAFESAGRMVHVRLDIEGADDFALELRTWDLVPVERASLSAEAERDLAEWVESVREEYRAYERDQRHEMRLDEAWARGDRWPFRYGGDA